MDHADDPGRPLVARAAHAELLDQIRVGRQAGDGDRAGVGHVRHQRAQRDDHLDAQLLGGGDDRVGEGAPAEVGLDPAQQDEIPLRGGDAHRQQRVGGPVDRARLAIDQADRGPVDLEVVEVLRVDPRRDLRVERGRDRL
jgi:hypothetical protein